MENRKEQEFLKEKIKKLELEIKNCQDKLEVAIDNRTGELKLSEEKFRLLFEKSHEPILIIDDYNFVECNTATIEILGYKSQEELFNVHPSKLSPEYQPDGKLSFEKAKEMMDLAYAKGYHRFEWIYLDKSGNEIYTDVALTKIPYRGKNMLFTAWRDISKQKEYEKSIIKSEKQYSTLFEQAADGILVGIADGEIVNANQSILKLTGYKKSELIGKNISILFKKEVLDNKPLRYDLVTKGDTVIRERDITRKDGKLVPVEMNTRILHDGRMQALFRDLSKRKEAEQKGEKSRKLLEKAEEVAGLGRYYYDINSDTWQSSAILNRIFGISEDYIKNFQSWIDIVHSDHKDEMRSYYTNNVISNRERFDKVFKIARINDKEVLWVHGYGDVEYDENDTPIRMIGTIQDITERKEAELALKASEEKYRNIFHHSPLGIFHYSSCGIITDCNKHFARIIGSSKENLIGLNMLKDLKNEKIKTKIRDSFKKGESYYEDWYESVTADKNTFVRILFKNIKDDENKTVAGIGLVEDITERKIAEQNLLESEEKFKSIATLLPEVIYETDIQGNLTFVNLKAYEIFEYTPEDFKKGVNVFQMLAPEEIKRAKENIGKILKNNSSKGEKYIALTKSGKRFPIFIYSDVVIKDNNIVGLRGIIVNISEIEMVQEEVRKSEEKFRLLFENSQDGIFITDDKGIVDCNSQAVRIFGCNKKEELTTRSSADFSPKFQPDGTKSAEKVKEYLTLALKGEKKIFEWLHSRLDGSTFYADVSLIPFIIDNKQYLQSIVRDITERKEIEQRIVDTIVETEEKERQRLASDIHDEIGPLLSSLKMYIESMNETNDVKKQRYLKEQLQSLIKESIINVREVSNALSPYLLNKYGLSVAIKSFLENSEKLIKIKFETNLEVERFPINIETVYYRIIKELFNNTIKHANAAKIDIALNYVDNNLILIYEDDGKGINKKDLDSLEKKGIGLFNITNRIMSINGKYQFITKKKKGFGFQLIKEIEKL